MVYSSCITRLDPQNSSFWRHMLRQSHKPLSLPQDPEFLVAQMWSWRLREGEVRQRVTGSAQSDNESSDPAPHHPMTPPNSPTDPHCLVSERKSLDEIAYVHSSLSPSYQTQMRKRQVRYTSLYTEYESCAGQVLLYPALLPGSLVIICLRKPFWFLGHAKGTSSVFPNILCLPLSSISSCKLRCSVCPTVFLIKL